MIIKILKNVSGSVRNVLNTELQDNESYNIPYSQWAKLADHGPTLDDIQAGLVVVNDGAVDLSITDALNLIRRFDLQISEEVPFDNSDNGFAATNVQDAIEEAKSNAVSVEKLREVTVVSYPFGPVSISSNLLFEPDTVNGTILFLKEETQ